MPNPTLKGRHSGFQMLADKTMQPVPFKTMATGLKTQKLTNGHLNCTIREMYTPEMVSIPVVMKNSRLMDLGATSNTKRERETAVTG